MTKTAEKKMAIKCRNKIEFHGMNSDKQSLKIVTIVNIYQWNGYAIVAEVYFQECKQKTNTNSNKKKQTNKNCLTQVKLR